ncbi:MAG: hypothetical protein MK180_04580 [Rhodobacteraceae bacterium]|nr:hypothetical protein [Paracoccaceae bacterium]
MIAQVENQASEGRSHRTRRPMRALVLLDCSADEALCDELVAAIHENFLGQVVRQTPWGTLEGMNPPPPEAMALKLEYVEVDGQTFAFLTVSRGKDTAEFKTAPIAQMLPNQEGVSMPRRLVRDLRSIVTSTSD